MSRNICQKNKQTEVPRNNKRCFRRKQEEIWSTKDTESIRSSWHKGQSKACPKAYGRIRAQGNSSKEIQVLFF